MPVFPVQEFVQPAGERRGLTGDPASERWKSFFAGVCYGKLQFSAKPLEFLQRKARPDETLVAGTIDLPEFSPAGTAAGYRPGINQFALHAGMHEQSTPLHWFAVHANDNDYH